MGGNSVKSGKSKRSNHSVTKQMKSSSSGKPWLGEVAESAQIVLAKDYAVFRGRHNPSEKVCNVRIVNETDMSKKFMH